MTGLAIRRCCDEAPARGGSFIAPAEGSVFNRLPIGEVFAVVEEAPAWNVAAAIEEAGHAVAAVALGAPLTSVTIANQPHAACGGVAPVTSIAVTLAGPIAERWSQRHVRLASDEELTAAVERVRACGGGGCDECLAARAAVVLTRHAPTPDVVATLRSIERQTLDLIRTPAVWRAINAVAAALRERGTLAGAEVVALCDQHFVPGSARIAIPFHPIAV